MRTICAFIIALGMTLSQTANARQILINNSSYETAFMTSQLAVESDGQFVVNIVVADRTLVYPCPIAGRKWDEGKAETLRVLIVHSLNNDDRLDVPALIVKSGFCEGGGPASDVPLGAPLAPAEEPSPVGADKKKLDELINKGVPLPAKP